MFAYFGLHLLWKYTLKKIFIDEIKYSLSLHLQKLHNYDHKRIHLCVLSNVVSLPKLRFVVLFHTSWCTRLLLFSTLLLVEAVRFPSHKWIQRFHSPSDHTILYQQARRSCSFDITFGLKLMTFSAKIVAFLCQWISQFYSCSIKDNESTVFWLMLAHTVYSC